jgi:hypothetical protein
MGWPVWVVIPYAVVVYTILGGVLYWPLFHQKKGHSNGSCD